MAAKAKNAARELYESYQKLLALTEKQRELIKAEKYEELQENLDARGRLIEELDNYDLNSVIASSDNMEENHMLFSELLSKLIQLESENESLLRKNRRHNVKEMSKVKLAQKNEISYGHKQNRARIIDSKS